MKQLIQQRLQEQIAIAERLKDLSAQIEQYMGLIKNCLDAGGKLIFMGNGGSSTDSMHFAAEFVAKFSKKRKSLPALSLSENMATVTAIANDLSYDYVFARQLESLATQKDLVIGLSTSGESKNIIEAFKYCSRFNIITIAFTADTDNSLSKQAKYAFKMPSTSTARVQESYMFFNHLTCELIDQLY